jgi:Ca2+-binding EF-hand superfamily protein
MANKTPPGFGSTDRYYLKKSGHVAPVALPPRANMPKKAQQEAFSIQRRRPHTVKGSSRRAAAAPKHRRPELRRAAPRSGGGGGASADLTAGRRRHAPTASVAQLAGVARPDVTAVLARVEAFLAERQMRTIDLIRSRGGGGARSRGGGGAEGGWCGGGSGQAPSDRLDDAELVAILRGLDLHLSPAEAAAVVAELDTDDSGDVDVNELNAALRRARREAAAHARVDNNARLALAIRSGEAGLDALLLPAMSRAGGGGGSGGTRGMRLMRSRSPSRSPSPSRPRSPQRAAFMARPGSPLLATVMAAAPASLVWPVAALDGVPPLGKALHCGGGGAEHARFGYSSLLDDTAATTATRIAATAVDEAMGGALGKRAASSLAMGGTMCSSPAAAAAAAGASPPLLARAASPCAAMTIAPTARCGSISPQSRALLSRPRWRAGANPRPRGEELTLLPAGEFVHPHGGAGAQGMSAGVVETLGRLAHWMRLNQVSVARLFKSPEFNPALAGLSTKERHCVNAATETLGAAQLRMLLMRLELHLSPKQVADLVEALDLNGDGQIDVAEFARGLRAARAADAAKTTFVPVQPSWLEASS